MTAAASSALPAGGEDRRALLVMSAAHGVQHFYVGGLAVTYPFVVASFHFSYATLGLLLTAAGLVGGLLQGAAGLLPRVNARLVITVQNVGLAAVSALGAVAPGFAVFGTARILGSAVSWPQHPVGSAYLSERFPVRRATALSWHNAGGNLGTVAVPLFASAVIAAAGWRWSLVALAGALAVGGLLVWIALPPERAKIANVRSFRPVGMHRLLLRRRVLAVLAASTIAAGGRGLGTLTTYVPAYLRSGLHMPVLTVGALFTVVMAASIGGPVLGGVLADRFGVMPTLLTTYVGGAAALVGFGWSGHNVPVLVVLGLLVGALAYTESPLLQAVFSELTGEGSARSAFGAFFAIAYGVGALWTAIIGWVVTTAGFPTAFTVMGASFLASALILVLFARETAGASAPGPAR